MAPADGPAGAADVVPLIHVTVVYSPSAGVCDQVGLSLPESATVAEAVRASGLCERHPGLDPAHVPTGVWGALRGRGERLREGDRVELYRPLQVDPKEARRRRQRTQQGSVDGR